MKKITKLPKPSRELIDAAIAVINAIVYRKMVQPIVKDYQKEILARHQFHVAKKWVDKGAEDEIVLDPEQTYELEDADFQVYLEEVHQQHLLHNFKVEKDYCPLLIAQNLERRAKQAFFELSREFNIMDDDIFEALSWQMDNYNKYIDLTMSYVANFIDQRDLNLLTKK